jgi:hypothetical protein
MSNIWDEMDAEIERITILHQRETAFLRNQIEYLEAALRRRATPEDVEPTLHDVFNEFPIRVCNITPQEDDK